jgi:serine/threonine protein kinase
VLPPGLQAAQAQRLLQPLELRRTLRSPHVLHIYDWGIEGKRAYIVTDPPYGVTLRHVLDVENISISRALDIVRQIILGLMYLHKQGISGLDLRPHLLSINTAGEADRVQIDDLGLRTILSSFGYKNDEQEQSITYLDPRYAPPEYLHGLQAGPWSDIYQTGLLLFELITGRPPFVGRTYSETGMMQSASPVPSMQQFTSNIPEGLQAVVERALAKEPIQRFPNARAFLIAVEAIQDAQRSSASTSERGSLPGAELTKEISALEVDIALQATLIEKQDSAARAPRSLSEETPLEEGVYAYLSQEQHGVITHRLALRHKSVIIGRSDPKRHYIPDIDLSAFDPKMTVSRQHARIRFEESFFSIEDLKSRNKTRKGGAILTPLKAELLEHGDIVSFGSVRMIFEVPKG